MTHQWGISKPQFSDYIDRADESQLYDTKTEVKGGPWNKKNTQSSLKVANYPFYPQSYES